MASVQPANRNLLHRVQDLIRRKPNSYDVVFCVGPYKKEVKAVRILLEAASPALEKKFEFWEDTPVYGGSMRRIPIPDFVPEAFEMFVKLTMLDDWTTYALTNMKLQPVQILNLISICRAYEMETALNNLEYLLKPFYSAFATYKNSPEFLRLSCANLKTILMSDNLPLNELDVFDCACRWAKAECSRRKLEGLAGNLRLVLGACLFEIRFPLMAAKDFTQCVKRHSILTPAEGFEVFKFIATKESSESDLDVSQLSFKTNSRAPPIQTKLDRELTPVVFTLCLTMDCPIVDSPFVCDGRETRNWIATKKKILLHGLGFLGPIDGDANYNLTVRFTNSGYDKSFAPKTIEKRISAQKSTVFRIMFDQPITFTEGSVGDWTNFYRIYYSLKGPNTTSFQRNINQDVTKGDGGNEFRLIWGSNQLAEILYTNV